MPSNNTNRIYSFPRLKAGNTYTITVAYSDTNFPTFLYFGYYINGVATRLTYITTDTVARHSFSFNAIEGATYCLRMGNTISESAFLNQVGKINGIQIEAGSTATDYEEYQGQTISVSWATGAGTVYFGTLDVITGVLTVTWATVDMGTLNWERRTTATNPYFRYPLVGKKPNVAPLCSIYKTAESVPTLDYFGNNADDYTIAGSSNNNYVVVRDDRYSDSDSLKTALSGISLVYALATPQTYQLDPNEIYTLDGINNVYADTGDVTVTYLGNYPRFSFGSPLRTYNYTNLKLFGNTYIEHGKG